MGYMTLTVWLLVVSGTNGQSANTIDRFASKSDCETVRSEAIEKITGIYKAQSACIKATVLVTKP